MKLAAILIQLGSGCLSQIPRDETLVGDVTGSGARALNYSVVSLPRSPSRLTISCSGHIDEWHLVNVQVVEAKQHTSTPISCV